MKKILILLTMLLGLTFADMIKDHAYVISAIGIKNVNGEIAYISGSTNTPNVDGSYNLVPQVIIYDGSTSYIGAATPFTGCIGNDYYFSSEKKGSCFMGGTMKGATSSANGESGLVPAPAAGQQSLFLRGDGTWAAPEGKNYSNATTSASGLMSAADKTKLDGINLSNYALVGHTHDDRYYTEAEVESKVTTLNNNINSLNAKLNYTWDANNIGVWLDANLYRKTYYWYNISLPLASDVLITSSFINSGSIVKIEGYVLCNNIFLQEGKHMYFYVNGSNLYLNQSFSSYFSNAVVCVTVYYI